MTVVRYIHAFKVFTATVLSIVSVDIRTRLGFVDVETRRSHLIFSDRATQLHRKKYLADKFVRVQSELNLIGLCTG